MENTGILRIPAGITNLVFRDQLKLDEKGSVILYLY
jgi:hypothetical protein